MQVDALVFQSAPKPLDEDVVEEPAFSIHRDPDARPAEPFGPGKGRELGTLIRIRDLGRPELVDGLVERFDAEVGLAASGRGSVRSHPSAHSNRTSARSIQLALPPNRQIRVVRLDHAAPHVPPQGFSFRSKKELATASSPILAWSSFTCSSSISGFLRFPRSNTPDAPSNFGGQLKYRSRLRS